MNPELGKVQDTQALLAAIVESSEDAIVSKTLDGVVTSWNPAAERMFGYRAAEMIGQSITRIIPADRLWEEAEILAKVRRGERVEHLEVVRVARDGRPLHISLSVSPVRDGTGRIIGASKIARDIGRRRELEHTLNRREQEQRLLVALNDATRDLHDPLAVMWEVVSRLGPHLGVSRCAYGEAGDDGYFSVGRDYVDGVASIAGRYRLDDFGPGLMAQLRRGVTVVVEDVAADTRLETVAERQRYAQLQISAWAAVPLVKEGCLVAALIVQHSQPRRWLREELQLLEQIAERTWFALENARTGAALAESRNVLALAMRAGRMGVWWRRFSDDRVWWSRELEEIFGLVPGTFAGSLAAFTDRVHPDDREQRQAAVERALRERTDYAVEFRFRHTSGDWRWMESRGRAVYGPDGQPTMLYGLGIDVTERRRVEEALRESDRRKNEFLAVLAHELRNPLAPIRNSAQFMRLKAPADAEVQNVWKIIDRQAAHLGRLVDDLLDVSRISSGKINLQRERVTLSMLVTNALEAVRPLIEQQQHQLVVELPPQPVYLDADPVRMTQVLQNLLNNAAKYTPPGGHIVLAAREDGGQVRVSVRDNGAGIPADMLPRVFEMFTQVDRSLERRGGGLGIGLTLVQRLVELHGGRVEARSDGPGRGSEFSFRLPVAAPRAAAAASAPMPAMAAGAARRVLVVDDNVDAAQTLAMTLRMLGHEVHTADDGLAAIEAAERVDPDVVLLDIGLPHVNGYDAARRIRALPRGRRQLLVALTGWGQDEDRRRSREAGFDHHLVKPVDAARLSEVLADGVAQG